MKHPSGPRRGDAAEELLTRLALDERDGPALPIGDERALRLARLARERCAPEPRGKLSRLPKLPLIGLGVVIASTAAAAALEGFPRLFRASSSAPALEVASASDVLNPKRSAAAPPAAATVGEPLAEAPPVPVAEPEARPPADEPRSARAETPPPVVRASRIAVSHPSRVGSVAAPESARAADLLGAANRARGERRSAAALAAYRQVIARYPETRQAQIARVSAGDLELERGNARAAQELFSKAARDTQVGAEALFGLAEAYRAESRAAEERRALTLFEERYPADPLAAAARRRLAELGASAPDTTKREPHASE